MNAWNTLNQKQKWLFLLQTDLLGNRVFMRSTPTYYYKNNPNDGCGYGSGYCGACTITGGQRACGSCEVWDPPVPKDQPQQLPQCWNISAYDCYQNGLCWEESQTRTDYTMALEHVEKLYAILGYGGVNENCGGEDNNRIFWQAKDPLIQAFRNRTMPEWGNNKDELKGPHSPFDNASATLTGRPWAQDGPDGQAQFYSWDTTCSYGGQKGCSPIQGFARGGAYLPADSRMFELDNDYNIPHDSSPLCYYGGQYAVNMYQNQWCNKKGNAAPCDWNYIPGAVSYSLSVSKSGTGSGTVTSNPAGINCGTTCSAGYSGGTQITLTATASAGSTFAGWSGACSGTGGCTVTMDSAKSVSASFNPGGGAPAWCYSGTYPWYYYGFTNWLCNACLQPCDLLYGQLAVDTVHGRRRWQYQRLRQRHLRGGRERIQLPSGLLRPVYSLRPDETERRGLLLPQHVSLRVANRDCLLAGVEVGNRSGHDEYVQRVVGGPGGCVVPDAVPVRRHHRQVPLDSGRVLLRLNCMSRRPRVAAACFTLYSAPRCSLPPAANSGLCK